MRSFIGSKNIFVPVRQTDRHKKKAGFDAFSSPEFSSDFLQSNFKMCVSMLALHEKKDRDDRGNTDEVTVLFLTVTKSLTSIDHPHIPNCHWRISPPFSHFPVKLFRVAQVARLHHHAKFHRNPKIFLSRSDRQTYRRSDLILLSLTLLLSLTRCLFDGILLKRGAW